MPRRARSVGVTSPLIAAGTKLLFLDIDGVLNRTRHSTHVRVDDDLMANLKAVIERTGCVVVWSTFWRGFQEPYLDYVLMRYGLGPSVGATPGDPAAAGHSAADETPYAGRAEEIAAFLCEHTQLSAEGAIMCPFVVLDDRSVIVAEGDVGFEEQSPSRQALASLLAPRFVRTVSTEGLKAAAVDAVVALFS